MNQLEIVVKEYGLETTKAEIIKQQFNNYFDMASDWERKAKTELTVKSEKDVGIMKMAREARLFLRGKRLEVEKTRKEMKEQSLKEGRAIDGVANVLKGLIEPIEDYLEEQEKYAEIQLKKRREALAASRVPLLTPYGIDPAFYDLENMPEDNFIQLLRSCEIAKIEKEAEAKRAEEERLHYEAEKARKEQEAREENERLRQEMIIYEQKLQAEKEARENYEKELRIKEEEIRRKEIEERQAREKAEAEELARKKAADAEVRKLKRAPDKSKLLAYSEALMAVQCQELKSPEAIEIYETMVQKLTGLWTWAQTKIEEL